jgi:hypothetical protein
LPLATSVLDVLDVPLATVRVPSRDQYQLANPASLGGSECPILFYWLDEFSGMQCNMAEAVTLSLHICIRRQMPPSLVINERLEV